MKTRTWASACLWTLALWQLSPALPHASADEDATNTDPAASRAPAWIRGPDSSLYPVEGWKSCSEARAHQDFPVFRGQPGYNPALDPNHEGVECT